jgi:acetyl esterase/lipase
MPLDPRVKRFLDALAMTSPSDALSLSVTERRHAVDSLLKLRGPEVAVGAVRDGCLPGSAGPIPIRSYDPPGGMTGPLPGIVYFHGGGLVAGSLETHDGIARALTGGSGCRLISIEYRLAPEAPFPAAVEDAVDAVRYVMRHPQQFGMSGRIAVCGDSAGATLAAVTCQALHDARGPVPQLQVLLCPIMDYADRSASRREFASGYLVDEATLRHDLKYYLPPGTSPADPRVSPLRAEKLPASIPTVVHTAECDPLRDEAAEYALRMRQAGAAVSYTCHAGMIHLFYGLGGAIPYARQAVAGIAAEIGTALRAAGQHDAQAQAP